MATSGEAAPSERKNAFENTTSPHPAWVPGGKQPVPYAGQHVALRPEEVPGGCYHLMISSVVPRPIALCSTISGDGQTFNLAPYSYFGAVSHDPPCVVVSICRSGARGGGKKDTLVNAEATGELCINIMSEWYVESANHCCGNYDPGVDEFELSGLSKAPSKLIKAPRVAEAAVSLECKVRNLQEIENAQGKVTTTIVLAEVIMFHLHEGVYTPPPEGGKATVDCEKLQPISRLGGNTYGTSLTNFDLPRPDRAWQQKKEETDGGKDKA
jgi:flavin reductase (DIM6/NTAB) family NADH-FMN oxidoreductase RutF